MKEQTVLNQILEGSRKGQKVYAFDEAHDPDCPSDMWFQESPEGLVLFIVFYTQACRWSRCLGCNLPSRMSVNHVSYRHIMAQVDHVFSDAGVLEKAEDIRKVIVSNNGSVLDEHTFSSTALMYLVAKLNLHFPKLGVLSMETRPEYVEVEELEFLSRALAEGETPTVLELAIGFEAFDEYIRNEVFNKGLSLDVFEKFVGYISPYGFRLKCYFMQKPVPGMEDDAAIEDIQRAMDYLDTLAGRFNVRINMHLNPTYVARGTALETAFRSGEYRPPRLMDVARALFHARDKRLSVFVGLFDEGLAVPGGSFISEEDADLVRKLEMFNKTGDYGIVRALLHESHG